MATDLEYLPGCVVRHEGRTYRVNRLGLGETDLIGTDRRGSAPITVPGRPGEVIAPDREWVEVIAVEARDRLPELVTLRMPPVYGWGQRGPDYPAGTWVASGFPLLDGMPAPRRVLVSTIANPHGALVHYHQYEDAEGVVHAPWCDGGYVTEMRRITD